MFKNIKNSNFLHIPKTAGTALAVLKEQGYDIFNIPEPTHEKTLFTSTSNTIFVVRDPWERFCSGFWEIKTLPMLHKNISKIKNNQSFQLFEKVAQKYPIWYKQLIAETSTPNNFCDVLKNNQALQKKLYSFDNNLLYKKHTPLGLVTQSITWWLGNLEHYQNLEYKVVCAIDIKSLRHFMNLNFDIEMPTDPFLMRSRDQFDTEQSYACSKNIHDWFVNDFRKDDYTLLEYIKQQPYYFEKAPING